MVLSIFHQTKLICVLMVLIIVTLMQIKNVKTQTTDKKPVEVSPPVEIKTPVLTESLKEQKTFKKELKVVAQNTDVDSAATTVLQHQSENLNENIKVSGEKSVTETKAKTPEVLNTEHNENKKEITTKEQSDNTNNILHTKSSPASPIQHHEEEGILLSEEEIPDSLKTGFYFFLALSSGAVIFILFKIYRLRLSRAERKYGVQGDRSNQELTPLPLSIEDGHSDDEDQTVFEVQRHNIRIL